MYDYEVENQYRQSRLIDGQMHFTRADALLLGILLAVVDLAVVPALGSAHGVGELIVSVGLAVALTAGAALSFRSALRWDSAALVDDEIETSPVAVEEWAKPRANSKAA